MKSLRKLLFALVFACFVAGLSIVLAPGQNADSGVAQADDKKAPEQTDKSGKDRLPKNAGAGVPGMKAISMAEAVTIGERVGKGYTLKAERKDKKEQLTFRLEILGFNGAKQRIELRGDGEVLSHREHGDDDRPEKKKEKAP